MAKVKEKLSPPVNPAPVPATPVASVAPSRLEYLRSLYETLKIENIRSISDLENKIAQLQ